MQNTVPENSEIIMCEVCLTEIPRSVSRCEGQDYVYHFCGPACYAKWTGELSLDKPVTSEQSMDDRPRAR